MRAVSRGALASACAAVLALAALALASPGAALADGPVDVETQALQVERQLSCPTCTNVRLDFCDLQICNDMRVLIRERLAAGDTEDQIVDYFRSRYGDRVLATPTKDGLNLVAWGLPFVAGLGGLALVALLFLAWRRRMPSARIAAEPPGEPNARVRAELERFRDGGSPWA